jgi:hypothetical protein
MNSPHVIRKTTDPTLAPPEPGIHWINTTTNVEFFSVGTTSVTDWIPRSAFGGFRVHAVTLTSQNIADKFIVLPTTPLYPQNVVLVPMGGIQQLYGVDYEVIGNVVTWSSLGLDGFLEINDVLVIQH